MKEQELSKVRQYIQQDQSLKGQLQRNEQIYRKKSQLAFYANLEEVEHLKIFSKSTLDVQLNVVFTFIGSKYQPEIRQRVQCYIIRTLDEQLPKLKNQYSLAYLHNSFTDFLFFKNLLQTMPQWYFNHLKNIYFIRSGLLVKFYQLISFGSLNRLIDNLVVYYDSIQQLEAVNKVSINSNMIKSKVPKEFERNSNKSNDGLPEVKLIRNQIYGKLLQEYPVTENDIPKLMEILIKKIIKNQQFQRSQGIFRKNCDLEELQQLQKQIIAQNFTYIDTIKNPYIIVGCLKKIFNNLDEPLFHYSIYETILKYRPNGDIDQISFTKQVLEMMKPLHKNVLLTMVVFLMKAIVLNEPYNKMSAYNLSVVFGPCFFRPKQYKLDDLINSGKFAKIILNLFSKLDQIISPETYLHYEKLYEHLKNN